LDQKIENNEEKRIIYVAATRPSKILVIAVPEIDKIIWTNKFFKNANYNKSLIDFS
jgi:superfamily I DNA/RNA helicase